MSKNHDVCEKLDKAGMTASTLCAIHCAILPLVITLLPFVGLSFLASEPVEWVLVATAAVLGIVSLYFGHKKHKSKSALLVLSTGLGGLVLGHMLHHYEIEPHNLHAIILAISGLVMASAHYINYRLCKSCPKCSIH